MKRCINPLLMNESTLRPRIPRGARNRHQRQHLPRSRNLTDAGRRRAGKIVEMSQVIGNKYAPVGKHRFHTKLYEITGNHIITEFQDICLRRWTSSRSSPATFPSRSSGAERKRTSDRLLDFIKRAAIWRLQTLSSNTSGSHDLPRTPQAVNARRGIPPYTTAPARSQ